MRLNQLRDFLAAVDCGSIRAASRVVGVSQPALTKSVRQLEEELGAVLIQRSSRGVTVTPSGRAFLARARAVQVELRKARDDLAQIAGRATGNVTVGVASVIGSVLIPEALARFRIKRPEGTVRIVEGTQETLLPLLRDQTLDLAVCLRSGAEGKLGLKYRPLFQTRLVVAARTGHPRRTARSLAELREADWLMFRPVGGGGALEEAFALEGLTPPRSVVHCESHGIALAILAASDTLGLLAPQLLAHPSVRGTLQEIDVERPLPALTVGLYVQSEAPSTPAAADFANALAAAARNLLRPG
jgi:LysR family transcriptional regulator, regulator of abg operon